MAARFRFGSRGGGAARRERRKQEKDRGSRVHVFFTYRRPSWFRSRLQVSTLASAHQSNIASPSHLKHPRNTATSPTPSAVPSPTRTTPAATNTTFVTAGSPTCPFSSTTTLSNET